jgi:hypothetical protein
MNRGARRAAAGRRRRTLTEYALLGPGGASQNSGTPEAPARVHSRPNGCKCRGERCGEIERLRVGGDKAGSGRFSDDCLGLSGPADDQSPWGTFPTVGNIPAWRSPA